MSFPRYSGYKDSEVKWLGEVPEHWDIRRVRRIFVIKKRIAGELGFDILSITQQGIKVRDPESNDGQVSMDYSKYQVVEPGDFAMNHMDLLTGYVDISRRLGVTSPDYRVFSIAEHCISDPDYLLYVFQMGYRQKILYAYGQGSSQLGRWRLPTEEFKDWAIPFPSLNEQAAIATFLDRETAKIDALIAEQQLLIGLLQEKRQAVISHAVTKGLNPNAPMKDSGVEWLGVVPEHWVPHKIGAISSLKGRLGWQGLKADEYREQGPYVVSSAHFEDCRIQWEECPRVSQERYDTDENIQLAADDVLLMKDGAAMGKLAFVDKLPGPACLNSHLLLFRPREVGGAPAYYQKFAFYFMQTRYFQQYIRINGTGATFLGISQDAIGRYQICCPPLLEQAHIATFIDQQTTKIDALIAEQQRLNELLKERRSALISAAVTGQIDVRGLATEEEP